MATYNLINSVKGGCGKTTLSVWLAYYLEKSLLIDMDLLGTSMQILIHGNDDSSQVTAHTNDVFQGVKDQRKRFVEKVKLRSDKYMNVIFSSMDYKERDRFKAGRHSGYTPVVKHSMFRSGLRELLKHHKTLDGETIEHFIFDMPPSSDGFSDAAMECILNPKYSDLKDKDRANLFMMIGADWGQTIATIEALKALLLRGDDKEPDRIFLVINQNLGGVLEDTDYNLRKDRIKKALETWSGNSRLDEKIRNKIVFLKMEHNKHYMKLGINGIGLKEAEKKGFKVDEVFNAIITAYAMFEGNFKDIATDKDGKNKLRKLISGEQDADEEKI